MFLSLRPFFISIPFLLVILKYTGLTLAAGSSVWATVNILTVTTPEGRKRLTPAGVVAIGLTVLGLVISVVSEDLQRRHAAEVSREQVASEARRTNEIIIAGQPLTSLSLTLSFHGLDTGLAQDLKVADDAAMAFIRDEQGERDDEQNAAVYREKQLYPFLIGLARHFGRESSNPLTSVVVLIALDDDSNAILPFGHLEDKAFSAWLRPAKNSKEPLLLSHLPSVETGSHADYGNRELQNWPHLETSGASATVSWRLDPSTFAESINRQNSFVVPTAKLPNLLRIAILFDIEGLPFKPTNFALPDDDKFWNFPNDLDSQNPESIPTLDFITKDFTSSARLVPNNSTLVAYSYKLNRVYVTFFLDGYGEARNDLHCMIFEYKLEE